MLKILWANGNVFLPTISACYAVHRINIHKNESSVVVRIGMESNRKFFTSDHITTILMRRVWKHNYLFLVWLILQLRWSALNPYNVMAEIFR